MKFSFNTFFGFEQDLIAHPEATIFGAMLVPLLLMIPIAFIGWVFRKLNLNRYIIHALLYTLMFTFVLGSLSMLILFFITDKNGIKLACCWLAILTGMFTFSIVNTNAITRMFSDWSKIIREKDKSRR